MNGSVTFVGMDADGDWVFELPNGGYASSETRAGGVELAREMLQEHWDKYHDRPERPFRGLIPTEYERVYGPIVKGQVH